MKAVGSDLDSKVKAEIWLRIWMLIWLTSGGAMVQNDGGTYLDPCIPMAREQLMIHKANGPLKPRLPEPLTQGKHENNTRGQCARAIRESPM